MPTRRTTTAQAPTGIKVRLWYDPDAQGYRIAVPYHPQFVELLKRLIPPQDRHFDDQTKFWSFDERFYEPVKSTIKMLWSQGEIDIQTKAQAQQAQTQQVYNRVAPMATKSLAAQCERFITLCGAGASKRAYQQAALENHPDAGGSADKMSELNVLWDQIQKELFGQ